MSCTASASIKVFSMISARALNLGAPRVGRLERLGHDVIDPGETAVTAAAGERRVSGALARRSAETLQPQAFVLRLDVRRRGAAGEKRPDLGDRLGELERRADVVGERVRDSAGGVVTGLGPVGIVASPHVTPLVVAGTYVPTSLAVPAESVAM